MKSNRSINHLAIFSGLLLVFLFLLIAAIFSVVQDTKQAQWELVATPDLSHQPLKLRVAIATNPRFKTLDTSQWHAILEQTRILSKQHLGVEIIFLDPESLTIQQLFDFLPSTVLNARHHSVIDPQELDSDIKQRIQQSLLKSLQRHSADVDSVIDYARPFLNEPGELKNLDDLSHELMRTHLNRMGYLQKYKARDGQSVLDGNDFNQWVWWDSLGYGRLPYDVVLTNQLVASIEDYDLAMHSSLRGGITGGTAAYNKKSQFNAYVFISVFQLINDFAMLKQLRNGEIYDDQHVIQYAAATLTHELGHMLFHYGHPFGETSCIMNPTPLLHYQSWYAGLDAEKCRASQHPKMRPGELPPAYFSAW